MKILVTGAAGFIGSHTADMLLKRGDTVIGLDNFNDYYSPAQKRQNAALLAKYETFRLVEADIRNRERMLALFEQEQFDAVAHIAAMAGVRNSVAHPALYTDVDLNGTQHLMDAARFSGVGNFVFASTSSVYGNTQQIPFVETDPCAHPPQPYAAAKRAAELLGYTYHTLYQLNFTAVRFFTVYGPRGRPDMMPFLLANSIFHGTQTPLHRGEFERDWTYVDDTVRGIVQALDTPLGYEIINLGRGNAVPLAKFIAIMEQVAGKKAQLYAKAPPAADMLVTYANIDKAKRLLGFNPTTTLESGVKQFWDWFVQQQAAVVAGQG